MDPVVGDVIVTVGDACAAVNVAVTALCELIVKVHEAVPPHAPLHPANVDPGAAETVRVTDVPPA
jgi:hypothetical protein